MKFSKGQKEIGEGGDQAGILLQDYAEDEEASDFSKVEYYTDHQGAWYIYMITRMSRFSI